MTDGNCAFHAVWKSASPELLKARLWSSLASAARNTGLASVLKSMRDQACRWIHENANTEVWPGCTVGQIIRTAACMPLQQYLDAMRKNGAWADTMLLHGLACAFSIDIIVFQVNMEPALLGASLMGPTAEHMVPVALVNDSHFWAMQPASSVQALNSPAQAVNKGDPFLPRAVLPTGCSGGGDPASAGAVLPCAKRPRQTEPRLDEEYDCYIELPCSRGEEHIDAELSLCKALSQWHPFSEPSHDLVAAMKNLSAALQGRSNTVPCVQAALARQHAISQLALEGCALQARRHEVVAGWE